MVVEPRPKSNYTEQKAESYVKGRSDYPEEVIDFVLEHCHLRRGDLLIDVGSGTGISSRAFSRKGLKVIGIEPSEHMRQQAQSANDQLKDPNRPIYKEGTGENIDVPDHSANIVLAAQSFHWCDPQRALAEFARVLKPGGWIVLLWHPLDESDRFTRAYADLMRKYCRGLVENQIIHLTAGVPLLLNNSLANRNKFVFREVLDMSEEDLCNRALSDLFAPKENTEEWLNQLRGLHKKNQTNGSVVLRSLIELYVARCP